MNGCPSLSFWSRVSTEILTYDIDINIAILSACLSVRPSVCHVPVLYRNGLIYHHRPSSSASVSQITAVFPTLNKIAIAFPLRWRWIQMGYIYFALLCQIGHITTTATAKPQGPRVSQIFPSSWPTILVKFMLLACSGRQHRCPIRFLPVRNVLPLWKFTVVTLGALLTRDLLAIGKFLVIIRTAVIALWICLYTVLQLSACLTYQPRVWPRHVNVFYTTLTAASGVSWSLSSPCRGLVYIQRDWQIKQSIINSICAFYHVSCTPLTLSLVDRQKGSSIYDVHKIWPKFDLLPWFAFVHPRLNSCQCGRPQNVRLVQPKTVHNAPLLKGIWIPCV